MLRESRLAYFYMKNFAPSILISTIFVTFPAMAVTPAPCEVAESRLALNYAYLSPKSVRSLKDCVAKHRICLVNDEERLVTGESVKDVAKDPVGITFGLYQPDADTCLLGQFSGGSAAAWLFDGWRTSSGKPAPIKNFDKTELNGESAYPEYLIKVMDSGLSRSLGTGARKKSR